METTMVGGTAVRDEDVAELRRLINDATTLIHNVGVTVAEHVAACTRDREHEARALQTALDDRRRLDAQLTQLVASLDTEASRRRAADERLHARLDETNQRHEEAQKENLRWRLQMLISLLVAAGVLISSLGGATFWLAQRTIFIADTAISKTAPYR